MSTNSKNGKLEHKEMFPNEQKIVSFTKILFNKEIEHLITQEILLWNCKLKKIK